MGSVIHPEEADDRGGRPWPAPSTDGDWWRAGTADTGQPASGDTADTERPAPTEPVGSDGSPAAEPDGPDGPPAESRSTAAAQPAEVPPTAAPSTAAQPTGARPTAARPTAAQPTAAQPTAAQPTAAQPTGARPTGARPTGARPARSEAAGIPPGSIRSEAAEAPPSPGARPYDRPPRTPDRPAATTGPSGPRRTSDPVAWVTAPVPVVPPVPIPPARPAPAQSSPTQSSPTHSPRAQPSTVAPAKAVAVAPARAVPAQRTPRYHSPRRPPRRRRPRKLPRGPWLGIPALVVLAFATSFFAWVSAEPFWLAVGHGRVGTATVSAADNGCRGFFLAADGSFIASDVDLRGLGPSGCTSGTTVTAHMVSDQARQAYATTTLGLHLRWLTGLALVVVCGLAIIWLTGAGRFPGWRRGVALGLSLAAPAAVTVAMLTAAF